MNFTQKLTKLDLPKAPKSTDQILSATNSFSDIGVATAISPSDKTFFTRDNPLWVQAILGKFSKYQVIFITVFSIFICLSILGSSPKAHAAEITRNCIIQDSMKSGVVGTNEYRTIFVIQSYPDVNDTGDLLSGGCSLNYSNLTWRGKHADTVWWGTRAPGIWGANLGFSCVPVAPNFVGPLGTTIQTCTQSDGNYGVFQDDGSAIAFGSGLIYCIGIPETYTGYTGNCGNIYDQGWYGLGSPNAFRGAGYNWPGAGTENLTYLTTTRSDGNGTGSIDNVPIRMWTKNTWPGGYQTVLALTLRYPLASPPPPVDKPPTITVTANCSTQQVSVRVNDPDGGSTPVRYRIGTGVPVNTTQSNFAIPMASYDYNPTTVTAWTAGVAPLGATLGAEVSASALYGKSSTRGCKDRDFTITAKILSGPILSPDNENPDKVTFNGVIEVILKPTGGAGVRAKTYRNYFIRRSNGSEEVFTSNASPTPDSRLFAEGLNNYTEIRSLSGLNLSAGDKVCMEISVDPAAGTVDINGNTINTSGSSTAESCGEIVDKPYFSVFHNDISTGGGFGTNCNKYGNASIDAFYDNKDHRGSGSMLGVLATGQTYEFPSALLRGASKSPFNNTGLTFANTGVDTSFPETGGSLGSTSRCMTDYFSATKGANFTPTNNYDLVANASATGQIYLEPQIGNTVTITGTSTTNATSVVPGDFLLTGRKIIYVDGNVIINKNLVFAGADGGWTTIDDIPSLYIVARGNIYIDSGTERLEGVFVAQPKNPKALSITDGRIYTCANANGASASPLYTNSNAYLPPDGPCSQKRLLIVGSFVAQQIKLLRTGTSLRYANSGEFPSGAVNPNCANAPGKNGNNNVCGAEIFTVTPDMYLVQPFRTIINKYDAITSLPPIL